MSSNDESAFSVQNTPALTIKVLMMMVHINSTSTKFILDTAAGMNIIVSNFTGTSQAFSQNLCIWIQNRDYFKDTIIKSILYVVGTTISDSYTRLQNLSDRYHPFCFLIRLPQQYTRPVPFHIWQQNEEDLQS